ncbi:hypothetical protein HY501_03595 [Candidatus Woesearchaeota archaeon]|nr:hypothetical protein [Candidatus Woesearchaeota archaeon]
MKPWLKNLGISGLVLGAYAGLSNLVPSNHSVKELPMAAEGTAESVPYSGADIAVCDEDSCAYFEGRKESMQPYELSPKAAAGAAVGIGGLAALMMYGTLRINKKRK